MSYDLIVIGAGPAGMAAALAAYERGLRKILILERDTVPGGILNQCIHNGFGLHYFKEMLTGPAYAERFIERLKGTSIELRCDSMVLRLTPEREVHVLSYARGYEVLKAEAVVLAMGCRERTRGAIAIPGDRPSGVLTAGAAQRFLNIEGLQVGRRVLILGSGDIGLIMARRMVLEGAEVLACVELMPFSSGLTRNRAQCLDDFGIPLLLSHTVTEIHGMPRLEAVTVMAVDPETRVPIPGTEQRFEVDTLLLSVGLIPENELTRQLGLALDPRTNGPSVSADRATELPGVFACGNVLHVHDLVDYVSMEAETAGRAAADFVLSAEARQKALPRGTMQERDLDSATGPVCGMAACAEDVVSIVCDAGADFSYTVPQTIRLPELRPSVPLTLMTRPKRPLKGPLKVHLELDGERIQSWTRLHLAPGEMETFPIPVMEVLKRIAATQPGEQRQHVLKLLVAKEA